jgi:ABC-type transport system involved in multi-copper enzyme maturation permease subunit
MKIFKLSKAEMQKIFAKPGIFIVAFLFILTTIVSAFIYNMPDRSNGIVTIFGSNVQTIYSHYTTPDPQIVDSKANFDAEFNSIVATINNYSIPITPIENLRTAFETMRTHYSNYSMYIKYSAFDDALIDQTKHTLKNTITSFETTYDQEYSNVLVTQKNHLAMQQFLTLVLNTIPNNDDADNLVILNNLNSLDFLNVIEAYIDELKLIEVNSSVLTTLSDNYLSEVNARLAAIDSQIVNFYNSNAASTSPAHLNEIKTLISNYKLTIEQFRVIAFNMIDLNVLEGFSNVQINEFIGFEDINMYELKENLSKNLYLFQYDKFSYEFANPFNIASASNSRANAFDFAYFTLELFSFIIIIYVVVLGAGMIAGEEANGTMKLLAMRPYKRHKIFIGKLFAALRVAVIFLVIGAVASFITGIYLFGSASLPILSVFNMEYVIISSPYLMFLVYLFTLFLEILFYTIIAVSISSIFKSYTGAVTISVLIYFISMILPFVPQASWMKFIPLTNTNLFNYFGSAFAGSDAASGLNSLLSPPILLDSNFVFSIGILSVTMIALLIVALNIFNKRDLK